MGAARFRDAAAETFADVELLLYDAINQFCRRYRFDREEAEGIARLTFIRCLKRWDKRKASFTHYVRWKLEKELMERVRTEAGRHSLLNRVDYDLTIHPGTRVSWRLVDLLFDLSDDAREVVKLVLDTPKDIKLSIFQRPTDAPFYIRGAIREYLEDCGWTRSRIKATFAEITNAL